MNLTIAELSLLVIAGIQSAKYAKGEGASSVLAAVVGVAVAILIVILVRN